MSKKMLIDSNHEEEIRVVVLSNETIEEFDFETTHKKQIKGNIYLAKVERVEPSLQAAFVSYGTDRHGFLPFSEIHPDYYQIPLADKEKLINESNEEDNRKEDFEDVGENASENEDEVTVLNDHPSDYVQKRKSHSKRSYQIQEVIKKRQILLVQVMKEERGNKGAALTTYLSLAGRYSVLMPNTPNSSGVSRKVGVSKHRLYLKSVLKLLDIPKGMSVIARTAGATRTKLEIRRDYEYLLRLWENIRSLTLRSIAPCLIHEEGSLVKRSIRDLYSRDMTEILVSGDDAYREAKDFIKMLIPSHAKAVQPYKDPSPIFMKYNIEEQLDIMLQPTVHLKSGGYLVIQQTEALVSIDVNSGKSTKEANIENTALQTNLEAAAEVARQLRLRDLSGLVVIDFIDMSDRRNNRQVEKMLRDCLKSDRARIQVGMISHFGLLEMSRQRLRSSVLESTTQKCTKCNGDGYIRSDISAAIYILRVIEERLCQDNKFNLRVKTLPDYALCFFNKKKNDLVELERKFNVTITVEAVPNLKDKIVVIEKSTAAHTNIVSDNEENEAQKDMQENLEEKIDQEVQGNKPKKLARKKRIKEEKLEEENASMAENVVESDAEISEKPKRNSRRRKTASKLSPDAKTDEGKKEQEKVELELTEDIQEEKEVENRLQQKGREADDCKKPRKAAKRGWWQKRSAKKSEDI